MPQSAPRQSASHENATRLSEKSTYVTGPRSSWTEISSSHTELGPSHTQAYKADIAHRSKEVEARQADLRDKHEEVGRLQDLLHERRVESDELRAEQVRVDSWVLGIGMAESGFTYCVVLTCNLHLFGLCNFVLVFASSNMVTAL